MKVVTVVTDVNASNVLNRILGYW